MQKLDVQTPVPRMQMHRAAKAAMAQQAALASGLLQGQPVQQLNIQSVLANAADELSQQFSSKAEERNLNDRKLSSANSDAKMSRAKMAEMLGSMGDNAEGQDKATTSVSLTELAKRILKQPGQARQFVKELGGDATSQYLSLLEVAELIREGAAGVDFDGDGANAADEAAAELLAEQGDHIWADINTFDSAQKLAQQTGKAESANTFRAAYRDSVLGSENLSETLRHLLKANEGGKGSDFDRVLKSMLTALGADVAATRPSTDPVRLKSLLTDLYHLEVISTVIDRCDELSSTLASRHGVAPFQATGMASDLVSLTGERWVDAARLGNLSDKYGALNPPPCNVHFISGARNALRELPVQIFQSAEARQTLLDAAQTALDRAIDREEGLE
jgi:type III secretion protein W